GDRVFAAPGISVKLSALHPRYEIAQGGRVIKELTPKLLELAELARDAGIGFTVDAEEADRLRLSLEVFARVCRSPSLAGWNGYGLAVQAYQKRAVPLVEWLIVLARESSRRIPVRLVKGAYWDTEIKRAQENGLEGYPVFTRKSATDVSYLACARRLLAAREAIYPQFATHNAHTLASIIELADGNRDFEFQRLHGMGEELYAQVVDPDRLNLPCRVYAPVGSHEDLLPYLVRRLLENGANTSFVNRIVDEDAPVEEIIADPVAQLDRVQPKPHPVIPRPEALYGEARRNSRGVNLADPAALSALGEGIRKAFDSQWTAVPLIDGSAKKGKVRDVVSPTDRHAVVGQVVDADEAAVDVAMAAAVAAQPSWDARGGKARAQILERAADLFEEHAAELCALCVREAGKTLPDCIAELREAVDFLRYYAMYCRRDFAGPELLPGPTGEANSLQLIGRGVFVCISPWNFPLAIFTGQVAAALAAGNAVVAKPAEQTPLVAAAATRLLLKAGVPAGVLHLLPGDGAVVGARAVADPRLAGVAFTGSTQTAKIINRTLAARDGAIATLIAETGGQNAMVVDSSALPEQVVLDVVRSAFGSAGQRCSALRVVFLQEEIADRVLTLLRGYMDELVMGDPALMSTDVGPVIDADALAMLNAHAVRMAEKGRLVHRLEPSARLAGGNFFGPVAVEIDSLDQLSGEVFGPFLHVIRYKAKHLDKVMDAINASGYGLTFGIHSRIDTTSRQLADQARVGNVYVNRNMIGAVVGVQPFGGCGLSGTGPKAGGPHYLHRFATEKTVTVNTAAVGGNTSLLTL
ncbi:MAG: bifunctional proline dehydrogenase/L-glutamate gamma-semialdehyde dehydrogenase PutA, partial [Pseudomonadota bacterium]